MASFIGLPAVNVTTPFFVFPPGVEKEARVFVSGKPIIPSLKIENMAWRQVSTRVEHLKGAPLNTGPFALPLRLPHPGLGSGLG